MNPIDRLTRLFERFPGIGPRQAGRFVQFLLRSSAATRRELVEALESLGSSVRQCPQCMRFHSGTQKICGICSDPQRDAASLAVVASDTDLAALERSGTYRGHYFVLGGTIFLASEKTSGLRIKQLLSHINDLRNRYTEFKEIILAFPANPEGDATAVRIREEMFDLVGRTLKVTSLGRGLSTGSELEYADPDTIHQALANRQ